MKLYMIAGEKSGDIHGALLLKNLLRLMPGMEVRGLGGHGMHALCPGVEDWADEAAVIGVVEVLKKYGWFRKRFLSILEQIRQDQPDCLILIDYPGFNLRLAEKVRKCCPHTKIIYFISPQVWAWHRGRIPKMVRMLDLMMCIFPFEASLFQEAGLKTEFVGHPLVDEIASIRKDDVREASLVGLFPGSRNREIDRHFPVFIEVVRRLSGERPELSFETAASTEALAERMRGMAQKAGMPPELFHITVGGYHELMDRATMGVVASGTATMEAALHRLPYMLVYKVPLLTYWMARMLIKIRFIGMVNILAQKSVVKELIQFDFTPDKVIEEIERLLVPENRDALLADMKQASDKLVALGFTEVNDMGGIVDWPYGTVAGSTPDGA